MLTYQEIDEQPAVIERILSEEWAAVRQVAASVRAYAPRFVYIAARGTSDHAALYAKYLFGIQMALPVALAIPSAHTLYRSPPDLRGSLVIAVSQSGQSLDILQVVQDARSSGALTIAITNDATSPIARAAAHHLDLRAGPERSVAATKTYTAQLTMLAALVAALRDDNALVTDLQALPDLMAEALRLSAPVREWVGAYRDIQNFATIGRGFNLATAYEISLKIKELCYLSGEEYSEADFRHGPIAVVDEGFPVLVVIAQGVTAERMIDLTGVLVERKARCFVISNATFDTSGAARLMPFPQAAPEWLSPVVAVVPGQLLAASLAEAKGYSPDNPRGLSKVTITE